MVSIQIWNCIAHHFRNYRSLGKKLQILSLDILPVCHAVYGDCSNTVLPLLLRSIKRSADPSSLAITTVFRDLVSIHHGVLENRRPVSNSQSKGKPNIFGGSAQNCSCAKIPHFLLHVID